MSQTRRIDVVRWRDGAVPDTSSDELAAEEPLEILIGGEPVTITMRTPGHDFELVAGLLLSEGLLEPGAKPLLRGERVNSVNVALTGLNRDRLGGMQRATIVSTSCGICGKATIDAAHQQFPPVDDDTTVSRTMLPQFLSALEQAQSAFARTGGLHAAALFRNDGSLVVAREDVGRHNAVDKAIGHAVIRGLLPLSGHTLLVSSRASFEIVQKALGARVPIVAAVSAPSSLAVDFAAASGQTLIGFVRGDRCNVYTNVERVTE